jgi:uncharacterized repeat protein (TIGR03803 family)
MKHLRGFIILLLGSALLSACGGGLNPATRGTVPMTAGSHSNASSGGPSNNYRLLYSFKGTPDGASPYSGLVAVNGTLYGTTLNGSKNYCSTSCGSNNCYLGCGAIFSVDAAGSEKVIYNFQGNFNSGRDGSWPFDTLTLVNGQLYGTTSSAGQFAHGTVFTTDTSGNERVLYGFMGNTGGGKDGEAPEASLTPYVGRLVGTTVYGGGSGCGGAGCGIVYYVTTIGKEVVIYRFKGGSDGMRPYAGVTVLNKNFYGATLEGGTGCGTTGCGTIYEVNINGKERVLHRFAGGSEGAYPNGLIAVNGVLYGTTEGGGTKNSGTFFSITPSGTLTTLYNFTDIPDGNLPGANLIYSKGTFYGTTVGGGTAGDGTVFSVTKSGSETVLYSFKGGSDGKDAQGPLHLLKGWLYGTTTQGGGAGCGGNGCGTIFKVKQ